MINTQFILEFSVLKTLLEKGFFIGLFSSMPVGPIAIMCIQRTLSKGRWHGFFTGCGAALSDLIYALIAGFGLAFVSDFINENQLFIQVVGSIVILIFGYFIYRSNPSEQLAPAKNQSQSFLQDVLTSFALTITNPMMIFLFIGLYARFQFVVSEKFVYNLFGISAIFVGALTWWFFLVSIVNIFRKNINIRNLRVINIVTGVAIIAIAIFGLVYSLIGVFHT